MLAGVARYFLPLFSVVSHSISILQYVYPVVFILGYTEIRIFGLDFLESWLKIPLVPQGSIPESPWFVQVQEQVAHLT